MRFQDWARLRKKMIAQKARDLNTELKTNSTGEMPKGESWANQNWKHHIRIVTRIEKKNR